MGKQTDRTTGNKLRLSRRTEHVSFDVETSNGPGRLEVDLAQASQLMSWARQDYLTEAMQMLEIEEGQPLADLPDATRRSYGFHSSMGRTVAGSVVAARVRNGTGEAEAIDLDPETMAELPEAIFMQLWFAALELNPDWAPAPAPSPEPADGEDGETDPKKTTGPA
jgi:hypothetical protein